MSIGIAVLAIEGAIVLTLFGLLIYFIVRRIEERRRETFEDRDN